MATSISDGGQSAVIGTEHTLATITAAGTYILKINAKNMASADKLVLRVYDKVRSVGTSGLAYISRYMGEQTLLIKISIPNASPHETIFTLEQTAGTGRDYDWEIVSP